MANEGNIMEICDIITSDRVLPSLRATSKKQALQAQQYVLAPVPEEEEVAVAEGLESADGQPVIIADMETHIDTLTVGEAASI